MGWTTIISPYYTDNLTNKPREVDLIAEKAFDGKGRWSNEYWTVNVQLFIECKYISNKNVFWFHEKNLKQAEELITSTTHLRENNTYTQQHHYLNNKNRAAKLFADEKSRDSENEIFYKALNQSLNSLIYYREKGSIIKLPESRSGYIKNILTYPVVLCNSFENLYKIDFQEGDEPKSIDGNFHLEVNYAYLDHKNKSQNEYFLIDIVSLELIENFMDEIKRDTELENYFLDYN